MKSSNSDIQHFLSNPEFIDWVKNPTGEKNKYWEEFILRNPDARQEVLLARELLLSISFQGLEADEREQQEVLEHVLSESSSLAFRAQEKDKLVLQRQTKHYSLIAAAVFIFALVTGLWQTFPGIYQQKPVVCEDEVVKEAPKGQKAALILPDGTQVYLNAGSEIAYQSGFSGPVRHIKLKGEAYFEVARDTLKPFVVEAEEVYVKALGTAFSVSSYKGEAIAVSLTEGKVEVGGIGMKKDADTIRLLPGEKAVISAEDENFKKESIHYLKDLAWKEGVIYFEGAGYEEVKRRLERLYDVEFVVEKGLPAEDWKYKGTFQKASLEQVLRRLSYVQSFDYEIRGNAVYLNFRK